MNLFITPHPPIILEEIGRGEEKKAQATIDGMTKVAEEIARIKPKTIAFFTPHGNVFSDALCINTEEKLSGNFAKFRHGEIGFSFENDLDKAHKMCTELVKNGISCLSLNSDTARKYHIGVDLDHGVLVPLYFIAKKYSDFKIVHISIGFLSKTEMYEAGRIVSEIMDEDGVILASGDLSHKLKDSGPYSFDEMGPVYDKYIVSAIREKRYIDILDIDGAMLERAGQCAQKPLEMAIGALEGYESETKVYSYEGPYGVGYMTAKIARGEKGAPGVMHEYMKRKTGNYATMKPHENEYVALAVRTIHEYIKNRVKIKVPDGLSPAFYNSRNGVFVSIKKEGRLRGCIGTIEPVKSSIAHEIIGNAISAATRDPRFNPIEEHELHDLSVSVDILFPPEDIKSREELNVKEYGVIVSCGMRRGLLLPNLEGVDTVDYQVQVALEKAGISPDEDFKMQRFKVVRHKMKEALFYKKFGASSAKCFLCPHECTIPDGHAGICRVRENRGGTLYAKTYNKVSSLAIDPIEKKPLRRYKPGTQILSAGDHGVQLQVRLLPELPHRASKPAAQGNASRRAVSRFRFAGRIHRHRFHI